MRSQKKAFNKFGKHLTCPETGISIMNPGSFLVKHDYKKKVIEEIEAFLLEAPFAQPSYMILYENVPVSVTYQDSMVYTVEQRAGNRN